MLSTSSRQLVEASVCCRVCAIEDLMAELVCLESLLHAIEILLLVCMAAWNIFAFTILGNVNVGLVLIIYSQEYDYFYYIHLLHTVQIQR